MTESDCPPPFNTCTVQTPSAPPSPLLAHRSKPSYLLVGNPTIPNGSPLCPHSSQRLEGKRRHCSNPQRPPISIRVTAGVLPLPRPLSHLLLLPSLPDRLPPQGLCTCHFFCSKPTFLRGPCGLLACFPLSGLCLHVIFLEETTADRLVKNSICPSTTSCSTCLYSICCLACSASSPPCTRQTRRGQRALLYPST